MFSEEHAINFHREITISEAEEIFNLALILTLTLTLTLSLTT